MPRDFPRTRRVGEQIKRDLADLIRSQGDDPRLALVSITGVEVTRDLAQAKVFITLLGDPKGRTEVVARLNHLGPAWRQTLGRLMHIRTIPQLHFLYDSSAEEGARLSALITRAVADDTAKRQDHDGDPTEPDQD